VKIAGGMFAHCKSLNDITPLARWDISSLKIADHMFFACQSLEDASVLNAWDVSGIQKIDLMFEGCTSLNDYPDWIKYEEVTEEE
jgi:hypothetical protein